MNIKPIILGKKQKRNYSNKFGLVSAPTKLFYHSNHGHSYLIILNIQVVTLTPIRSSIDHPYTPLCVPEATEVLPQFRCKCDKTFLSLIQLRIIPSAA